MSENTCPHGCEKRSHVFDAMSQRQASPAARTCVILNDESCPDCLIARLANLRGAIELILAGCTRNKNDSGRANFDQGLAVYYADLTSHLGPAPAIELRPLSGSA